MIPVLYEKDETQFTSNGLGRLSDAIRCIATEERNGIYELELSYPLKGRHFNEIQNGNIIYAIHDDSKDPQPFFVYRRSAGSNGTAVFYARHISYRLANIIVRAFSASSCAEAFSKIEANAINDCPFTFWTDKSVSAGFKVEVPSSIRSILGGTEGSVLDVFGKGEYEWDKFTVKLHLNRGTDSGVTIRYGKNLRTFEYDRDSDGLYNAVAPFWKSFDGDQIVTLPEGIVVVSESDETKAVALDLSEEFEEAPTEAQLRQMAISLVQSGEPWMPKENITVSFEHLWETEEYKKYAPLQRVKLCDTVSVYYESLGITDTSVKVIKTKYDVLKERYVEMELGEPKTTLAQAITANVEKSVLEKVPSTSALQDAIDKATTLITGGYGGYVKWAYLSDGTPSELYFMDAPDETQAINILRINRNGIGFSKSGINGPYHSAWTIDGSFVADFITAGTLTATLIKAGLLSDALNKNYWNMETGEFKLTSTMTNIDSKNIDKYMADVAGDEINDFATNVLNSELQSLQSQIDEKIITWYKQGVPTLSNNPAVGWTDTATKEKHVGDLYYDTDTGKAYIFVESGSTYSWNLITDSRITDAFAKASAAQDTADGKRRVFVSQPVPPYDIGDLWAQGTSGDIMRCSTARPSGSYTASDWVKASKYTDDTAVTNLNNSLTQTEIFNRLTNNGQAEGVYLQDGNLYINASYIQSGTINAIDIIGSVITFGSSTEKTVMQTETVTNTIDTPIASITTQYPAAVIRGSGVEIHGSKVVSLKGEGDFGGLNYKSEVHVSPYQAYLESWYNSPTANPQYSRVMVAENLVELMGRRTYVEGELWRTLGIGSIYRRPYNYVQRQFVSRQPNYVTAGTCYYTIMGDMCFLRFENLTFANLDHNNTLTDVAFWNVPRAKYGVTFVVSTYGESTHVCYGHRLRVNDDHVYFHYDAASSYTTWQFYGSVWYHLADNVGINDDGTFEVIGE